MRTVIRAASALLLATVATAVIAPPAMAQKQPKAQQFKFSKAVQPLLGEAQKKQQAGDNEGALALLNQADALQGKTPDDQYMISMLTLNVAIAKNDNALIEKSIEGALASGKLSAEEEPKFRRNLGSLALQRNDYAKAAAEFERLVAMDPSDALLLTEIAELQRRQGQNAKSFATLQQAIATQEKGGAKADEAWYRRALAIAYDSKLPAETMVASDALVRAYPSPTNWRDVLLIFRDNNKLDDQTTLDVLRLMRANAALAGEKDYAEYAETANIRGYPGEAKAVLEEGVQKGALQTTKPVVKELSSSINARAAGDKAGLATAEREARAAKTGRETSGTADAFLGYSDFAKAADLYKLALTKGGADNAAVNTRLGFALGKTGDKAGAEAALKAVTGAPRDRLAKLYLVWLEQQK